MTSSQPDVTVTGSQPHVEAVESALGLDTITRLAQVARANDVVVTLHISPFEVDTEGDDGRDPNDR